MTLQLSLAPTITYLFSLRENASPAVYARFIDFMDCFLFLLPSSVIVQRAPSALSGLSPLCHAESELMTSWSYLEAFPVLVSVLAFGTSMSSARDDHYSNFTAMSATRGCPWEAAISAGESNRVGPGCLTPSSRPRPLPETGHSVKVLWPVTWGGFLTSSQPLPEADGRVSCTVIRHTGWLFNLVSVPGGWLLCHGLIVYISPYRINFTSYIVHWIFIK